MGDGGEREKLGVWSLQQRFRLLCSTFLCSKLRIEPSRLLIAHSSVQWFDKHSAGGAMDCWSTSPNSLTRGPWEEASLSDGQGLGLGVCVFGLGGAY